MSSEFENGELAVCVQDVGKCYHIYERPQDRLKQALLRWRRKTYYREFWALRQVSLTIRRGEAVGIIGRNGSGKSTLLQIIAGTLTPSEGQVSVNGRLAALLELGSGFNPEFTGRENVFMNGAILGLSQSQMEARFDEIASFADIGEFIDQPVKTYSSGMFVRLAFAVATCTDPDILIVDEALSVGDMQFQHRCIRRIRQLCESGTTLIFVSHDPDTVRALCQRGLWLERGKPRMLDNARLVAEQYMRALFVDHNSQVVAAERKEVQSIDQYLTPTQSAIEDLDGADSVSVESVRLLDSRGVPVEAIAMGERFTIQTVLRATRDVSHISVGFLIKDRLGIELTGESIFNNYRRGLSLNAGERRTIDFTGENVFKPGEYCVALRVNRVSQWDRSDNLLLYSDETALAFRVPHDPQRPMWFRFRHPFEVSVS